MKTVMNAPIFPLTDDKRSLIENIDLFLLGDEVTATGRWYFKGGTFCAVCSRRYTFQESTVIYLKNKIDEIARRPRCPRCGSQLRTQPKGYHSTGKNFWARIQERMEADNIWIERGSLL